MDSWFKFKKSALEKLKDALEKEEVDKPIIPLLNKINKLDDFVTTSSCSGRMIFIMERKKKGESEKLVAWHHIPSFKEFKDEFEYWKKDNVWFKVEGFILHIVTNSFDNAVRLFKWAKTKGVKRGGIQPIRNGRFLIELIGTAYMSLPVKAVCNLKEVYKESVKRMEMNFKALKKLEEGISELNKQSD